MKILATLLFIVVLTLGSPMTTFAKKRLPRFSDYPSRVVKVNRHVRVKIRSTPHTLEFRTMLRQTAQNGLLFAGHYALGWWGCGTTCVRIGIVDLRTGRAYVSPFAVPSTAFKWKANSRLLFVNDPKELAKEFKGNIDNSDYYKPEYYLWTGRKLLEIKNGKIGREPEGGY